jgi:uncharacterized glyoxalase superfamily protein PhnB
MKPLEPAIPQLPSGDINKTEAFYNQTLGFETVVKYLDHNHLVVKRGNCEIQFWGTNEKQARELGEDSSCYIRTDQVSSLFVEFKEKNAPFKYELDDQPWGMKEMQIDDPYGNAIRFGFPIGE